MQCKIRRYGIYAQGILDSTDLTANLDKDAVAVRHSVCDYVIYDSSTCHLNKLNVAHLYKK